MNTSKVDNLMMSSAQVWAEASHSERMKVGAVISKDSRIIATGYNGTPAGFDNKCEAGDVTKPEVVHAEENAILFCAKNGMATDGATLYTTVSPCPVCAKMIVASGIKRVVYKEEYRDVSALDFLWEAGVEVTKM